MLYALVHLVDKRPMLSLMLVMMLMLLLIGGGAFLVITLPELL